MDRRYVSFLVLLLALAAVATTLAAAHHGDFIIVDALGIIGLIALAIAVVTLMLEQMRDTALILAIAAGLVAGFGWHHLPRVQRATIGWFPHTAWNIITTEVKAFVFLAALVAIYFVIRDLLRHDGRLSRAWRSRSNRLRTSP